MFCSLEKSILSANRRELRHKPAVLFTLLWVIFVLASCRSTSSKQLYENFGFGISLEKPGNWHAEYNERTRTIVLEPETGILSRDSALIVIRGIAVSPLPYDSKAELNRNIDRLAALYELDSVAVIQEPTIIENKEYEIATATISIPTISIPEESTANQIGVRAPDIYQIVDMRTIRCPDNFALVYIYKGSSEQLNAEAEAIVDTIELICATES